MGENSFTICIVLSISTYLIQTLSNKRVFMINPLSHILSGYQTYPVHLQPLSNSTSAGIKIVLHA